MLPVRNPFPQTISSFLGFAPPPHSFASPSRNDERAAWVAVGSQPIEGVGTAVAAFVGLDPDRVLAALAELDSGASHPDSRPELYGGGRAGEAIVAELERYAS